jgi:hypothetical protein
MQAARCRRIFISVLCELCVAQVSVPDPGSRDRDVVLVARGWWGNPRGGSGIWNGEEMGRG